ncbi:acetate--CoA ligase family protein [Amycolatopsis sp. WAC 01376]|uniref:acetate--CoA ligase family protein n=1 Tax=Amycolatopsis sp. WAC 01376 TaxID=2203195 RepID=UPI002106A3B4|nr:acetate--CoA ligase family protein [Amycolatopsis sp. WAC 01376]
MTKLLGSPVRQRVPRALAREKAVVAIRGAGTVAAQRAAAAHTAARAIPAATKLALFGQAGVVVVDSVTEVVGLLAALSWQPLPAGERVVVVSNAGGAAVLGAEACARHGLKPPELSADTVAGLRRLLPEHATVGNPLDTSAAVTAETFAACVSAVLADDAVDAVMPAGVPTGVGDPLAALKPSGQGKPVLAVRLGQLESVTAHAGIPCYGDVEEAAVIMAKLAARSLWLKKAEGTVPDLDGIDLVTAAHLVDEFLVAHPDGGWLSRKVSEDFVDCFGIRCTGRRFGDRELIVRAQIDETFGPVIVLGLGGLDEALLDDRVTALCPLTTAGVDGLMDGLRWAHLLFGGGDGAVDKAAVRDLLLRVSRMVESLPEIVDVDLDPVLASSEGAAVSAARVLVRRRPHSDPYLRALR